MHNETKISEGFYYIGASDRGSTCLRTFTL